MCSVAKLGLVDPPRIVLVTDSAAEVLITPPAGVVNSTLVRYAIMFRKVRSSVWRLTSEDSNVTRIISPLDANTLYEFKVVAKYEGETSASDSIVVLTKAAEGMLYFSFPTLNIFIT